MKRIQYSKEIRKKPFVLKFETERAFKVRAELPRSYDRANIPTTHEISIAVGIIKADCEVFGQLTCHLLTETIRP